MPSLGPSVSIGGALQIPVQLLCIFWYEVLCSLAGASCPLVSHGKKKKKIKKNQRVLKGRGHCLSEEKLSPFIVKHISLERGKGQFAGCSPEPVQGSAHWGLLLPTKQLQQNISSYTKHMPSTEKNSLCRSWFSAQLGDSWQPMCPTTGAERECSGLTNSVWLRRLSICIHGW